jgi:NAD+ synthase
MPKKSLSELEAMFEMDLDAEVARISRLLVEALRGPLRRRGLVVAVSGGIDSSVCAALAVTAVGADKVFGLLMPESESSPSSLELGRRLVEHLRIDFQVKDISSTLREVGCYQWREEAIRRLFPDYREGWRSKITIEGGLEGQFNRFNLVVQNPQGDQRTARLGHREYLQLVAATNFKQRVRKTLEYFHADRLNYAVVGTPNRAEYDQGFFVKNGDGSADIKPIAHLYKTQVRMMGRHLNLPRPILESIPTTDTYSLPQGQDEFYFSLPFPEMDVAIKLRNEGAAAGRLAEVLGISLERARLIFQDIDAKRRATAQLHWPALLLEEVPGPSSEAPPPPGREGR